MSRPLKQLQSPSELSQDVICHLMCHLLHCPAAESRAATDAGKPCHAFRFPCFAQVFQGGVTVPAIYFWIRQDLFLPHSTGVGTYFLACVQGCKQPHSSPQGNTYWHRPTVQGNGCESIFHCMVGRRLGSTPWCPIPVQTACNSAVQCHCFPTMRIGCEHGQYLLVRSKFQLLGSWQTGALRFGAASGALVRLALACVKPARRLPLLHH